MPSLMDMVIRLIVPDGIDLTDLDSMQVLVLDLVGAMVATEEVITILSTGLIIHSTVGLATTLGVHHRTMEELTMS